MHTLSRSGFIVYNHLQGCGIAMLDSSDLYIEPVGQVDFPGYLVLWQVKEQGIIISY